MSSSGLAQAASDPQAAGQIRPSSRELALMARKSYRTIMKWQSEGKLPPRAAVPGHPRYRLSDVEAWMKG